MRRATTTCGYLADAPASASWRQFSATFTAPATAARLSILHVLPAVGSLQLDDVSLVKGSAPTPTPTVTPTPTPTVTPTPTPTVTPTPTPTVTPTPTPTVTPTPTPTPTPSGSNLIGNPSMETAAGSVPAGWYTDVWGTNTSTFTHATNGRTGSRSVLVTMTQRTSGDAKWIANAIAVSPGASYSYSDYYISGVATQVYAMYVDAAGNYDVRYLADAPASASWRQFSATFTAPATAARLSMLHVLPAVGSLQLDDVSLTGSAPVPTPTPTASVTPTPTPTPSATVTPPANNGYVSITFDDGRTNQYDVVRPALAARGLKGTFFIIGDALTWGSGYMNASQVGTLSAEGHEIGNHSWNHSYLTSLSTSQIDQEFSDTQTALRNATGVTPTACAYPYGDYNSTVQQVAATKFVTCRTTDGGVNTANDAPPYALRTYYVTTSTTPSEIRALADQARASRSWIIFIYHSVGTVMSSDDVTTSSFTAELDQIMASGVTVLPVTAAYHALTGR
ncbi:MAG: polysaccharide deacetylase family protein [Kineosporiaceae bacterium]